MLNSFRNSITSKCFQILLLGYFLISSLNFSGSLERYQNNTSKTCVEISAYKFFYKIFKWDKFATELSDNEAKEVKGTKFAKDFSVQEYLIPFDNSWVDCFFKNSSRKIFQRSNPIFLFGFHGEIHLPPPQIIV